MENPATWGPAEKVVHDVISLQTNILPCIPTPGKYELSLERQITDALREAGLLKEEDREISAGGRAEGGEEDDARLRGPG